MVSISGPVCASQGVQTTNSSMNVNIKGYVYILNFILFSKGRLILECLCFFFACLSISAAK